MTREEEKKKKLRARLYGFADAVQEGALEFPESFEFWFERIYELFPHWISVEDREPEEYTDVIAIRDGNMDLGIYRFIGKGLWEFAPRYIACVDDITHWMPLPNSPVLSNLENTGKNLKGGEK